MRLDAIIIGAGVTGSSIARELARYQANILVLEKEEDLCSGTSKANTAIMHGGYDAVPGSLKARMNVSAIKMVRQKAEELGFRFEPIGSFVLGRGEKDLEKLQALYEQGMENGVPGLRIVHKEELHEMEPNLRDEVTDALYCEAAGIVDPFSLNAALAENAYTNGVQFAFNKKVERIEREGDAWAVYTADGTRYEARAVVNAAGLFADDLHNQVAGDTGRLHIRARRGEYLLLDRKTKGLVKHVLFPLPTDKGKGIVVTPTIDGNTLLGPTSVFQDSKDEKYTSREGLEEVIQNAAMYVKELPLQSVITSFSGLRAHEEGGDFILQESKEGFFDCVGIESPGLTSCFSIGEAVSHRVAERLKLEENPEFVAHRDPMVHTDDLSLEEMQAWVKDHPAYGQMICRCEKVSRGEILDAIHRPLGARTVDGVRRRTRASGGRCQGGFCIPRIIEILSKELGVPEEQVVKNSADAQYVFGKLK